MPHPLTDHQKICHMSATPTAMPNLVQIRPQGASGEMGEIQQKLFLFTGSYCLVDTSRGQPRV